MAKRKKKSLVSSYIKCITPPYKHTDLPVILLTFLVIIISIFTLRPVMAQLTDSTPSGTLEADTVSPQITITYPADESVWWPKAAILFRATATDNVGIAKVDFYINGNLTCTDTTIDQYGYTCSWYFPNQRNSTSVVEAKAYDLAGNFSSSTIKVYTSSATPTPASRPLLSKRVFVTSTKYTGNLGGLSGADAKCQTKADRVKLGGIWKSWLSDSNTSVSTRLNHSENPYVRLDNKIVANNWSDLTDGELVNGINIDESGKVIVNNMYTGAWTGTSASGNIQTPNCADWTDRSTRLQGVRGGVGATYFWSAGAYPTQECSNGFYLYCFEQ